MKWYILCILIGILLFLFVNNVDRFSVGVPDFQIVNNINRNFDKHVTFSGPDIARATAEITYDNGDTGQVTLRDYITIRNQFARRAGQLQEPYPGNLNDYNLVQLIPASEVRPYLTGPTTTTQTPMPESEPEAVVARPCGVVLNFGPHRGPPPGAVTGVVIPPDPTGGAGGPQPTGSAAVPTYPTGGAAGPQDFASALEMGNYNVQRQRGWNNLARTPERTIEMQRVFRSIYRDSNLYTRYGNDVESAWDYVRGDIPNGSIKKDESRWDRGAFTADEMQMLRYVGFTQGIINKFNHN
jgi:hypothetical protein